MSLSSAGIGRVGRALLALLTLAGCSGEMSPTVTVTNQTDDIVSDVRVELAGTAIDIPPLRSREKARMPYIPATSSQAASIPANSSSAEATGKPTDVIVIWQGKRTVLEVNRGKVSQAINNVEILLTERGAVLDKD